MVDIRVRLGRRDRTERPAVPRGVRPAAATVSAVLVACVVQVVSAPTVASAAADSGPVVLRPDGDVLRQWTGTPGSAAAAIDDPVLQPARVDAADFVYGSRAGNVTEVTLASWDLRGGTAAAEGWVYANTGSTTTLLVEAVTGGRQVSQVVVPPGSAFGWWRLQLPPSVQGPLDDLRLRFTVSGGGDSNVRAAYLQVLSVTPSPAQQWAARSRELADHWAPYHLQDTDDSDASADYLSRVDFDGAWRTNDNWENQPRYPLVGAAYYAVAETASHWLLTYAYYHPRDWINFPEIGFHENDLEGVLLVVRRDGSPQGTLEAAVTVAHHNFHTYVPPGSPFRSGTKRIGGELTVAPLYEVSGFPIPVIREIGPARAWILQQAKSHAMHAWKPTPDPIFPGRTTTFPGGDGVLYRPAPTGTVPAHGNDRRASYSLIDMFGPDGLWARRGCRQTFASWGKFSGDNGADDAASAPWWWDDKDDALPRGMLVSDPARLVADYFSNTGWVSRTYTHLDQDDAAPTAPCG